MNDEPRIENVAAGEQPPFRQLVRQITAMQSAHAAAQRVVDDLALHLAADHMPSENLPPEIHAGMTELVQSVRTAWIFPPGNTPEI